MELTYKIDRDAQGNGVDECSMLGMVKIGPIVAELCTFKVIAA